MVNSTVANLSILIGCAIVLTTALQIVFKYRKQTALVAVIFFSVLLGFNSPALAMQTNTGTPGSTEIRREQGAKPGYEKTGNITTMPTSGSQYQGLTHPEAKGEPLSDQDIERRIKSKVPDSVVFSVSNGSVRVSGHVDDKKTAEKIVNEVQNIPGIHELTYDIEMTRVVSQ